MRKQLTSSLVLEELGKVKENIFHHTATKLKEQKLVQQLPTNLENNIDII